MNNYDARTRFLEMVLEGIITKERAIIMMLNWMDHDDIDYMLEANELKEIADNE